MQAVRGISLKERPEAGQNSRGHGSWRLAGRIASPLAEGVLPAMAEIVRRTALRALAYLKKAGGQTEDGIHLQALPRISAVRCGEFLPFVLRESGEATKFYTGLVTSHRFESGERVHLRLRGIIGIIPGPMICRVVPPDATLQHGNSHLLHLEDIAGNRFIYNPASI